LSVDFLEDEEEEDEDEDDGFFPGGHSTEELEEELEQVFLP